MNQIFISGPMTGLPEFNRPMFFKVEEHLALIYQDSFIYNPARLNFDNGSPLIYSIMNIPMLLQSQLMVLLPSWRDSRGCLMEYAIALYCGIKVIEYKDMIKLPTLTFTFKGKLI